MTPKVENNNPLPSPTLFTSLNIQSYLLLSLCNHSIPPIQRFIINNIPNSTTCYSIKQAFKLNFLTYILQPTMAHYSVRGKHLPPYTTTSCAPATSSSASAIPPLLPACVPADASVRSVSQPPISASGNSNPCYLKRIRSSTSTRSMSSSPSPTPTSPPYLCQL